MSVGRRFVSFVLFGHSGHPLLGGDLQSIGGSYWQANDIITDDSRPGIHMTSGVDGGAGGRVFHIFRYTPRSHGDEAYS